ncbi:hypothetical protein SLEP1_g56380 [Rubroshorea leprosula]|uniref:Uncharacterized protein n=1 Tax=Rubroshorea leprosula TaxID=152421 RepID=A0AAV5MLA2_9ROSI|nr:hypothetical protein SLEP1_g56380 [Rubroshorea leprosula]
MSWEDYGLEVKLQITSIKCQLTPIKVFRMKILFWGKGLR